MKKEEPKKRKEEIEKEGTLLVRISGRDILGNKNVYVGLTRIKGVSWSFSNALCKKLKMDKKRKISELSKEEISLIEDTLKKAEFPDFLKNRKKDIEKGTSDHFVSIDLDMKREFDIKRLKQIKSYKGVRHSFKLPVRGQRTRSHFRKSGIAVGVKRKK
jgi:small subunit ribosomal protein S13